MLLLILGFFLQVNGPLAQQWMYIRLTPSTPGHYELGSEDAQATLGHMVLGPDLASGQ